VSTYYFYACDRWFNISCVGYVLESLQPHTVDLRHQYSGCWERIHKQGVPLNKSLGPHYYSSLGPGGRISPSVSIRPNVMLVLLIIGMAGRTRAPDSGRSGTMGGQRRRIWWYTGRCERRWSIRTTLNYTWLSSLGAPDLHRSWRSGGGPNSHS